MHFLLVNVTFYDAVNMIHDVITKANPFPYTAKFMFVGVRNYKTQQVRRKKINRTRLKCCWISKVTNSVGRNDNFSLRVENYQFFQPGKIFLCTTTLNSKFSLCIMGIMIVH